MRVVAAFLLFLCASPTFADVGNAVTLAETKTQLAAELSQARAELESLKKSLGVTTTTTTTAHVQTRSPALTDSSDTNLITGCVLMAVNVLMLILHMRVAIGLKPGQPGARHAETAFSMLSVMLNVAFLVWPEKVTFVAMCVFFVLTAFSTVSILYALYLVLVQKTGRGDPALGGGTIVFTYESESLVGQPHHHAAHHDHHHAAHHDQAVHGEGTHHEQPAHNQPHPGLQRTLAQPLTDSGKEAEIDG